jgi:hypothetical protein
LNRPALLKFSCDECKEFVYDMQTGERETTCEGLLEVLRPVGPSGKPEPPCKKCPKGSPDREHEFILTEANRKTYQLYLEVQATAGARLTKSMKRDRWLLRNLGLIHRLAEARKESRQEEFLIEVLSHVGR